MTPLTLAEITAPAYAYAFGAGLYYDVRSKTHTGPTAAYLSLAVGGPMAVSTLAFLFLAGTLLFDLA